MTLTQMFLFSTGQDAGRHICNGVIPVHLSLVGHVWASIISLSWGLGRQVFSAVILSPVYSDSPSGCTKSSLSKLSSLEFTVGLTYVKLAVNLKIPWVFRDHRSLKSGHYR